MSQYQTYRDFIAEARQYFKANAWAMIYQVDANNDTSHFIFWRDEVEEQ